MIDFQLNGLCVGVGVGNEIGIGVGVNEWINLNKILAKTILCSILCCNGSKHCHSVDNINLCHKIKVVE